MIRNHRPDLLRRLVSPRWIFLIVCLVLSADLLLAFFLPQLQAHHSSPSTLRPTLPAELSRRPDPTIPTFTNMGTYGISLTTPANWRTQIATTALPGNPSVPRIGFMLAPPGWPTSALWGGFDVDVYPPQPTLRDWLRAYLPSYADCIASATQMLGNRPAYYLSAVPHCAPWAVGFANRYVVLGIMHSYTVSLYQNSGSNDVAATITAVIFPGLFFH